MEAYLGPPVYALWSLACGSVVYNRKRYEYSDGDQPSFTIKSPQAYTPIIMSLLGAYVTRRALGGNAPLSQRSITLLLGELSLLHLLSTKVTVGDFNRRQGFIQFAVYRYALLPMFTGALLHLGCKTLQRIDWTAVRGGFNRQGWAAMRSCLAIPENRMAVYMAGVALLRVAYFPYKSFTNHMG